MTHKKKGLKRNMDFSRKGDGPRARACCGHYSCNETDFHFRTEELVLAAHTEGAAFAARRHLPKCNVWQSRELWTSVPQLHVISSNIEDHFLHTLTCSRNGPHGTRHYP